MTTFGGFPDEAFEFYEGLLADNSKTYWNQRKDVYERAVREPMRALLDALAGEFGEGKLFRPNRDVRFSADKSPYKTHQGGYCATAEGIGYYVQVNADGLLTGGGFYMPGRDRVAAYRSAVDSETTGRQLEKVVTTLAKKGFDIGGDMVRTRPRGCPPDHPRLELMRHETLSASRTFPPDEVATAAALKLVRTDWRTVKPLVEWAVDVLVPA